MSAPTLILTPKKVLVPYDAERYALKSSQVEQGDLCYVADTGKWWLVVDVANLSNDNGYDNIHTDSVAESFTHVDITGTAGNGYITLPSQSSAPAAPAAGNIRIYSDSANKFAWIGASGFTRNFDGTLTASRAYTLPDFSGTVALIGASSQAGTLSVGTVLVGGGTAGAPSIAFTGQPSTGFYQAATGEIDVAIAGVKTLQFYPAGQIFGAQGNNYLQLNSSGAVALFASGTNQSITLTPSGTGILTVTNASTSRIEHDLENTSTGGVGVKALNSTGNSETAIFAGGTGASLFGTSTNDGVLFLNGATGGRQYIVGGSQGTLPIRFGFALNKATTPTEVMRIAASGNLLLGGLTTDGTGVLQFPAATTAAGGITLGTDINLYRLAAGQLYQIATVASGTARYTVENASNSGATFSGYFCSINNAEVVALLGAGSAGVITKGILTTRGAYSLELQTNGTAALTLDSSQNATFANNITLAGTAIITKPGGTIPLITTNTGITSGAGAQVGTLTNSPAAGNPTSWVRINDNGVTRYIPAW